MSFFENFFFWFCMEKMSFFMFLISNLQGDQNFILWWDIKWLVLSKIVNEFKWIMGMKIQFSNLVCNIFLWAVVLLMKKKWFFVFLIFHLSIFRVTKILFHEMIVQTVVSILSLKRTSISWQWNQTIFITYHVLFCSFFWRFFLYFWVKNNHFVWKLFEDEVYFLCDNLFVCFCVLCWICEN